MEEHMTELEETEGIGYWCGFCNFASSAVDPVCPSSSLAVYGDGTIGDPQRAKGLQPELFLKMSHEIYNYGEGLIGKVAADHSHKWVYKEPQPQEHEINFLTAWNNPADSACGLL